MRGYIASTILAGIAALGEAAMEPSRKPGMYCPPVTGSNVGVTSVRVPLTLKTLLPEGRKVGLTVKDCGLLTLKPGVPKLTVSSDPVISKVPLIETEGEVASVIMEAPIIGPPATGLTMI